MRRGEAFENWLQSLEDVDCVVSFLAVSVFD